MFKKILIANRGEIACRIIRTCKNLGVLTVAIYSDIDREALHVQQADEAFYVGGNPSLESYLNAKKIIAIAKKAKAEAIHPGYGFLAENAEFAKQCVEAGIIFIGPPAPAMVAMGAKDQAKKIMGAANVPLVPGYNEENQDPQFLFAQAKKIGFPVLIKPTAGGGGKGMRVSLDASDFLSALAASQREAKSSFNDDTVLLEKYLEHPRHIEIQVFADKQGNAIYLFERDCSMQRRHQKIIEEAPAPNFSETTRQQMGEAAIRAAKAIGYEGAGTIEFLVVNHDFYFMEMNTRLQVEHPVTEMICGIDLVEWQLRIAAGESLPLQQDQLKIKGHAIEARIYAEDPYKNFMPSVGHIKHVDLPTLTSFLRVDSGVTTGSYISQYYDPMIAKVIAHGENRSEAINRLREFLSQTQLVGINTNLTFLTTLLKNQNFSAAKIHTQFVDEHLDQILSTQTPISAEIYAIAAVYQCLFRKQACQTSNEDFYSPWNIRDDWRMFTYASQTLVLRHQQEEKNIFIRSLGKAKNAELYTYEIKIDEINYHVQATLKHNQLNIEINGHQFKIIVYAYQDQLYLNHADFAYRLDVVDPFNQQTTAEHDHYPMNSPMPGTVVAVFAKHGEKVDRGKKLIVIEAMKMEHAIHAPTAGTVKAIHYQVGDMVEEGVELLSFETEG